MPGRKKCPPGCKCRVHQRKPCKPECQCGKHNRTKMHNELISRGVRRAWKRGAFKRQQQETQ